MHSVDSVPESRIINLRGLNVLLDADLALLYGVSTKRLNEQVKRNHKRFPEDFMFQLTAEEKTEVVAICDHLQQIKFSSYLPNAFTEHGTVMLASVLNSDQAIRMSIELVRAFNRMRNYFVKQKELTIQMEKISVRLNDQDKDLKKLFEILRKLLPPKRTPLKRIGFKP